jgi:hypothetical protein
VLGWESGAGVGVPILIFVVGFGAGSALPARWLPDLGEGRVAGVAFLMVCGLVGMVFALVALHVYQIVRQLDSASSLGVGNAKPDVIANGLLASCETSARFSASRQPCIY